MIYIVENIGGSSKTIGQAAAMAAILEVPVMALFPFFLRKISSRRLLAIGSMFFIIKTLATLLAANVTQFLLAQIFQIGAFALDLPASVYLVNSMMRTSDSTKGQAYLQMAVTLGGIIGNLLGGLLLNRWNVQTILVAALVSATIGASLLVAGLQRNRQKSFASSMWCPHHRVLPGRLQSARNNHS